MQFQYLVSLAVALAISVAATPIYENMTNVASTRGLEWMPCNETSTDPNCMKLQRPVPHVLSITLHENGTWSKPVRSNWTREALKAVRIANNITSNSQHVFDVEGHIAKSKRETAPQTCVVTQQQWYDTREWGYWFQAWRQVGTCFYCDTCTDAIAYSISVTDTWTAGLSVNFNSVLSATFSFSQAQQTSITETRTCRWSKGETHGCHTIEYQPLMVYHNGWPNYQTHQHCYAGAGLPASDRYYDHNYVSAVVDQAVSGGVNLGNLGCGSGCGGPDGRKCTHPNTGGSLW